MLCMCCELSATLVKTAGTVLFLGVWLLGDVLVVVFGLFVLLWEKRSFVFVEGNALMMGVGVCLHKICVVLCCGFWGVFGGVWCVFWLFWVVGFWVLCVLNASLEPNRMGLLPPREKVASVEGSLFREG